MDDLDRLLFNVDNDTDVDQLKEDEKQNKTRAARKSDRNTGKEEYDETSSESFEDIFMELQQSERLTQFHNKPLEGIKPHWNYVIDFKNLLSDMSLPEQVILALRKFKYNFLKSIENIETLYELYMSTMTLDDFTKKSKQEVALYFPTQEHTHQHILFLNIKEAFVRFREFNSKVRKHWEDLKNVLTGMSLVNESATFVERAEEIIRGGLDTCKSTDIFIEFLGSVLYIPRKDLDIIEKEVGNRIYFREEFDYDYRTLFTEKVESKKKVQEEDKEDLENEEHHGSSMVDSDTVGAGDIEATVHHNESSIYKQALSPELADLYQLPGKSSWNTKEPYLIRIDPEVLKKSEEDLNSAVFFIHKKMEEAEIDAYIKRSMIRTISTGTRSIVKDYEEFLFKKIQSICEQIMGMVDSEEYSKDLFLYHCGPMTVLNTLRRIFEQDSYGMCYRRLSSSKITRFIPYEYIKTSIMRYFNQNVFIHNIPYNSIQDYNHIRQYVNTLYKESVTANRKKIQIAVNHKYRETGKKLSVDSLLMKKINFLYTPTEIEVYRRYIDRTIFRKV